MTSPLHPLSSHPNITLALRAQVTSCSSGFVLCFPKGSWHCQRRTLRSSHAAWQRSSCPSEEGKSLLRAAAWLSPSWSSGSDEHIPGGEWENWETFPGKFTRGQVAAGRHEPRLMEMLSETEKRKNVSSGEEGAERALETHKVRL